jgi:hypothetical protein
MKKCELPFLPQEQETHRDAPYSAASKLRYVPPKAAKALDKSFQAKATTGQCTHKPQIFFFTHPG